MKQEALYEISISLYYKDEKKAPKIGVCDIIYTTSPVPTIEEIRDYFKTKPKLKKYPTKIGSDAKTKKILERFDSVSSFRSKVLAVLKGKKGPLQFEENFEDWLDNHGCKIENKDNYIKVWRRGVQLTSW